ncbi:GTP-binding protein Rhes-like [Scleropages formosus]|uniref:GTP-binding protein Rhes-like n=1 Tax=Scleropages formosus TaxID=113540 RepID=A0A0P7UJ38_SCLFO|nr:ras-related protein Rap-1b-like [Scleropages formosus]KPP61271.1 GTP-binding protein Rhes-like [Scleropages formosus]
MSTLAVKDRTTVRLMFLGAAGVGKTALIQRFLEDRFEPKHKRTVEELHSIEYDIDGAKIRIEIMDTSGSYSFPAMRKLCIRNSDAFALVYSIDDPESFDEVQRLREEILELKPGEKRTPVVVVANKLDMENQRLVLSEDMQPVVELDWNATFVEASAKSSENVLGVFRELLQQVHVPSRISPALRRRRETLPKDGGGAQKKPPMKKHNSCVLS